VTINGWLRNCLWSEGTQVIQSYNRDATSAYTFIFIASHFVWSFSLMFLYSGRAYWQELIESIIWSHTKIKITPHIQPRALSITQGRAVGVSHFLPGGIGCTWSFLLSRIQVLTS
jgi:photosystem I P700 chlorophyll a apoprotein A1